MAGVGVLFARSQSTEGPYTIVQLVSGGAAASSRSIVPGDLLHAVDGTSGPQLLCKTRLLIPQPARISVNWCKGGAAGLRASAQSLPKERPASLPSSSPLAIFAHVSFDCSGDATWQHGGLRSAR